MKNSLNRKIRWLYSKVAKWWEEEANQKVDNYVALFIGTLGVAFVTLAFVLELCLELPVAQAEMRTQPGIGTSKPDVVSITCYLWAGMKMMVTMAGLVSFLGGSSWLIHKAYTKHDWYRNEEMESRIADIEGKREKDDKKLLWLKPPTTVENPAQ